MLPFSLFNILHDSLYKYVPIPKNKITDMIRISKIPYVAFHFHVM